MPWVQLYYSFILVGGTIVLCDYPFENNTKISLSIKGVNAKNKILFARPG